MDPSQGRSGRFGEKRYHLALSAIESQFLGRPARSPNITPTELSRFPSVTVTNGNIRHNDKRLKDSSTGYELTFWHQSFTFNPLKPELNPICYLLALLAHHFLHVSRVRVKSLTFRRLMSYIYMEHPFLMFLDHTQRRSTVGRTPLDE